MIGSFIEHFSKLQDPRIERKKLHALMDILVLTNLCGGQWSGRLGGDCGVWARLKLEWLRRFIPLKNCVPSPDCIAYVISRLSPEGFRRCFMRWTEGVREKTAGEVIAVDGKTARGSRDRAKNRNPLHRVSAWADANRLVLGQEATEEKSNEITAIPKLLALLDLHGCIVTLDAMGCQRAIAGRIVEQGGD
jgi:DDE_Tnp_1-associated/Transposase DDE domain